MFGPNIKHSICYICPHLDICISLNSLDAFFAGEFPRRGRLGLRSSSASTAAEANHLPGRLPSCEIPQQKLPPVSWPPLGTNQPVSRVVLAAVVGGRR